MIYLYLSVSILYFLIMVYFIYSYQKLKEHIAKQHQLICTNIHLENSIANQLILQEKELSKVIKKTENSFLTIKMSLFNLDFSFDEIFKQFKLK